VFDTGVLAGSLAAKAGGTGCLDPLTGTRPRNGGDVVVISSVAGYGSMIM